MSIPDGTADFISILTHAVNPATKTWKTNGEIIAAAVAEAKIEETVLNTAKAGDYRDAFAEKHSR
jgi:hypothetical protein